MPNVKNNVIIDIKKVEKILSSNNIPQCAIGGMVGNCASWWQSIKRKGGRMSTSKAKLLSSVLGVSLDYILASPFADESQEKTHGEQITKEISEAVGRIEKAIADLAGSTAHEINRLQIQMRQILKELGV